jgi:NhaP-type Na+/H+ or K+/H+ antiporter
MPLREILVAGWFGPKGFASVIYGIFVLESHVPNSRHLAHLIAIVVIGSMIAHSSTDVLIAQWFRNRQPQTPDP